MSVSPERRSEDPRREALLGLVFVSGATALVYEVLWLRELAFLFGSTTQAAATTLAAFFAGLAAGGWFWGRRIRSRSPEATLRLYAWLEVGVAVAAVGYFLIRSAHRDIAPTIASVAGEGGAAAVVAKLGVALMLLFPAAFFMGGTFPVMAARLVRAREQLGTTGSLLYATNTIGAALGAFVAGFFLPPWLGFQGSYLLAIAMNVAIAIAAFGLARSESATACATATAGPPAGPPAERTGPPVEVTAPSANAPSFTPRTVLALASASGFLTLALEVVVTRLFHLVTLKDVYSFAVVLVTFLLCLGAGGLLARRLTRLRRPERALSWLLLAAGVAVALIPAAMVSFTSGLEPLHADRASFGGYLGALFGLAALVLAVPVTTAGAVFPFCLRLAQPGDGDGGPGAAVGRLAAVNTVGAIAGSLAAGFLLVPSIGTLPALAVLAAAYLAVAAAVAAASGERRAATIAGALATTALIATVPLYRNPPVRLDADREERLVWLSYGAHGQVAVIHSRAELVGVAPAPGAPVPRVDDLLIRVDNHYTLGGLGALHDERRQAHLPLLLHPEPRSVFFLGLATGITAGAALHHPTVEEVVVAELVPEVIEASRACFGEHVNGLFDDPRVTVVADDGRHRLLADPRRYDVIVADLFRPWSAGAGSLYGLEHFETVRARLREGGLFAQWLPLYQLTPGQLGIIVRTLLEVFPDVTLWRGNFSPDRPIVALIARAEPAPLDPAALVAATRALGAGDDDAPLIDLLVETKGRRRALARDERQEAFVRTILAQLVERVPFTFYAGNVAAARERFAEHPINRDDRPVFDWVAAAGSLDPASRDARLRGARVVELLEELREAAPVERDPFLRDLDARQRDCVAAGDSQHRFQIAREAAIERRDRAAMEAAGELYRDYLRRMRLDRPDEGD